MGRIQERSLRVWMLTAGGRTRYTGNNHNGHDPIQRAGLLGSMQEGQGQRWNKADDKCHSILAHANTVPFRIRVRLHSLLLTDPITLSESPRNLIFVLKNLFKD